jgi:hypothetical protein
MAIELEKNVTQAEMANDTTSLRYVVWSRNYAITLYGLSVVWGAIQIVFPDSTSQFMMFSFLFALVSTLWARYDSLARDRPILPVLQMLFFLVWPIGALIYLVSRSGWRGVVVGVIHGFGLLFALAVSFYGTLFGLHFTGLLDQRYYQ